MTKNDYKKRMSFGLAGVFLFFITLGFLLNTWLIYIAGILIFIGGSLNFLVVALNNGKMPVLAKVEWKWDTQHYTPKSSREVKLKYLADRFIVGYFKNEDKRGNFYYGVGYASVGDGLLYLGMVLLCIDLGENLVRLL